MAQTILEIDCRGIPGMPGRAGYLTVRQDIFLEGQYGYIIIGHYLSQTSYQQISRNSEWHPINNLKLH